MATRKTTDPNLIAFLTVNYEKERWLRMHWVDRHVKNFERATKLEREPTNYTEIDIKERVIVNCMPTLARTNIVAADNRRTAPVKYVRLPDKVEDVKPSMIPVPELKEVLHESREDYFKLRNVVPPDKKYNFIECTNWKYGWKFNESKLKLRRPAYRRVYSLTRMNNVGPQPDPAHYITYMCNNVSALCANI